MRRQTVGAITTLEAIDGVLDLLIKLSAVVILAITGYYVYGILSHSDELFRGVQNGRVLSVPEFQRQIGNMQLLTNVLLLTTIIAILAVVARYYAFAEAGGALLVVGALLFFGMSFLIDNNGGTGTLHRTLSRFGDPRSFMKREFGQAGLALMLVGFLDLVIHGIIFTANSKNRRPRANAEAMKTASQVRRPNDRFLGRCWELPFCRDTDKKLCPIRASKKPCWRGGRGCYCDQNVILTISGGSAYQASQGSSGYLAASATVSRPKTLSEKRAQCLSCPVYLHHQSQKHRLLAPLSLVAAIAAFIFYWDTIKQFYPQSMAMLGRALSGLSFGTSTGGIPTWATELGSNPGLMYLIAIVAGMLVVTYLLHGLEWLLYRLGV